MNLVSVIVATHRRDAELSLALESVASQTYANVELVIIDDNGDEKWNAKVEAIVSSLKKRYRKMPITLITNPINLGSAKTRNVGIENAKGKYVTFLDDDDVYLPDKVKNQVEFMARGNYDYSITDLILYNKKGKKVDRRTRSYINDTSADALKVYHLKYHMTGTDTMMFKSEYLRQIGGFAPIDIGDEFYLMEMAIDGGGMFGYLPVCDVKAVVHTGEGGLSSGRGKFDGENDLFEYKKRFFDKLDMQTVKYIKTRHYATLSYAYLRQRKYVSAARNALTALIVSSKQSLEIIRSRK